jgi:hypothetical protein
MPDRGWRINDFDETGRTLARAHARSADPAVLAGYMGKSDAFDDATVPVC